MNELEVGMALSSPADLAKWLTARKGTVKYLYFWNHQPNLNGSIGRGCLSQWWDSPFELAGKEFRTAEHYMMWRKAMLFGDRIAAEEILSVRHPAEAKQVGRTVAGFDESVWAAERFSIVRNGNVAKFTQNPEIGEFLVNTKQRILVEASPVDRVWGIGLPVDDARVRDPMQWPGMNLLGFALMAARETIAVNQMSPEVR